MKTIQINFKDHSKSRHIVYPNLSDKTMLLGRDANLRDSAIQIRTSSFFQVWTSSSLQIWTSSQAHKEA
jgi:hypothetical protein